MSCENCCSVQVPLINVQSHASAPQTHFEVQKYFVISPNISQNIVGAVILIERLLLRHKGLRLSLDNAHQLMTTAMMLSEVRKQLP